ncbi:MAG TPA: methyltransferase domain-containing protein [bacterium]|nr:methyltransferase domain-containing protein [bacterium]
MPPSDNDKKSFFDHHAGRWDKTNYRGEQSARIGPLVMDLNLKPGAKVLDVGCGTGVLTPHILRVVGPKGLVVGLDVSPKMVRQATEKGFAENARFVEGDVERAPFADGYFDAVLCFSAFPHFDDQQRALREMHRVLAAGGSLFVFHLEGSELINSFHHGYGGPVKHDRLPAGPQMASMLGSKGFGLVKVTDKQDLYWAYGKKI